jgi:predicted permease
MPLIDDVRADVRYALRQLRAAPVFTAVAILSLGLGIGANTAIFSLMEQAIWKQMPVKAPEQLRLFTWVSGPKAVPNSMSGNWARDSGRGGATTSASFSYVVYQEMQRHAPAFDSIFGFKAMGRLTAIVDGQAELVRGELVTGNFYDALGVVPILGRAIEPADDTIGNGTIVGVISDGFWARRSGRDPAIVGKQVRINQQPVTIVGVNPPAFTGVESGESPDIFLPLTAQPIVTPSPYGNPSMVANPDYYWMQVMGRLKGDGAVSESEVQNAMDLVFQQAVYASLPDRTDRDRPSLRLLTGSRGLDNLREQFAQLLVILFAFVALVLLIACANVANLLLARAAVRRRELSLRLALGAGRSRIARQLLTEGLTLGIGGGLVGVVIGYWTRNAIPMLFSSSWETRQFDAAFDLRVLLLSLAVTIATSVLFSLAPIWQAMRVEINSALKDGGRSAVSLSSALHGKALIVFQVGVSVLLLIGAGLFVRTLSNLRSVNLGFNPDRILLFSMNPPRNRYAGAARKALYERLQEQIATIPAVEISSVSTIALVAGGSSTTRVTPEGASAHEAGQASVNDVGDRFHETMRIPIIAGRAFDARIDRAGSPIVSIVNQEFVRRFFPNDPQPIGRSFKNNDKMFQIVGICGDARYDRARNAMPPTFFRLVTQTPTELRDMTFELRTTVAPATIMRSVRQAVDAVDKDLPIYDVRSQVDQIDQTLARERLFAMLTSAFGLLALVLASIGIYGLMAHNVSRRTGEIGIRIALGAERLNVLLMVLREASWLAIAGVVLGVASAIWLGRYIKTMLFGVEFADPITIGGAIVLMLLVALLAGWLPARRASRLDPMVALRHD